MKLASVVVMAVACVSSGLAHADVFTVDVTANIDGRDRLIIQGNNLTWQHFENTPVGLHNASFPSTILTTTHNAVVDLSGYAWTPTWPNGTGYGAYSSTFTGLSPAIPQTPMTVVLTVEQARNSLTLVQSPTAVNAFTTIIEFNDNSSGSDANYQGKLTFTTAVPEPGTYAMTLAGLIAVSCVARRRRAWTSARAVSQT